MKSGRKKSFWVVSILLFLSILAGVYALVPQATQADDYEPLFMGLYLIQGEDLDLSQVEISVEVNNRNTSQVRASYQVTNAGKESTTVYMAMPVSGKNITNATYRFTPYLYNSVLVSGDRINSQIQGVSAAYDMWRAYSFPVSIDAGETKTAVVSYTVDNGSSADGRLNLSLDLEHVKSWLDRPEAVHVSVSFDARTVRAYNFEGSFLPQPTEMSDSYILSWDFIDGKEPASIRFSYSFVDEVIKEELLGLGNDRLDDFVDAYNDRNHEKVLELGREYVQASQDDRAQSLTYLLMADSYLAMNNYNQTMAVYELLGASETDFGDLDGSIQTKILLNKLTCLEKNEDYEMLYDTIVYQQTNPDLNYYIQEILDDTYNRIPEELLAQLIEERKPPTGLEAFLNRFLSGDFTRIVAGAIGVLIVIAVIIIYIRRKRKKQNFFY